MMCRFASDGMRRMKRIGWDDDPNESCIRCVVYTVCVYRQTMVSFIFLQAPKQPTKVLPVWRPLPISVGVTSSTIASTSAATLKTSK